MVKQVPAPTIAKPRVKLRLVLWCLSVTGVFSLLNVTADAIGSLQPTIPALQGFLQGCDEKPQPCWNGIIPGVTHLDEAQAIMSKLGYPEGFDADGNFTLEYYSERHLPDCVQILYVCADCALREIHAVTLGCLSDVRLGDVLDFVGTPNYVEFNPFNGHQILLYEQIGIEVKATSGTPHSKVNTISLYRFQNLTFSRPWHGFVPLWRYCQLEPALCE